MKQPLFRGVCTALVTPFLDNAVNYPMLEQLLRHQMEQGVQAVVLSGTTGEAATLSDAEKLSIFRCASEYVGQRIPVIAGTGTNSTDRTVRLSVAAEAAGADALLVVSPYYNKGNTDGLYKHFYAIAQAVQIPIILYNVPSRTGIDIPISVYQRLSELPNICGVKEATTDITKILRIRHTCPDDFYIWSGNDDQVVPVMSLGGQGVISVISNVLPSQTAQMTTAALAGDYNNATRLQTELLPVIQLMFRETNPIPVKYAMKIAGFDCGRCRLPLGDPEPETINAIHSLFN